MNGASVEEALDQRLAIALEDRFGARSVALSETSRAEHLRRLRSSVASPGREPGRPMVSPLAWLGRLARPAFSTGLAAILVVVVWNHFKRETPVVIGKSQVVVTRAPEGARVPEGLLDPQGQLHLVYGRDDNGFYVQAGEDGAPVGTPVLLNHRPGSVSTGGEHGPKIARTQDGTIHVVWTSSDSAGPGVWYTRSSDGGRTFERERNIAETRSSCESATVAADRDGRVWVFWLDGRIPSDTVMAAPIFMARSTDGGLTFTPNERVKHDHPGFACACCRLEARVSPNDQLYLSFRSAYENIRDAYLLRGPKTGNNFRSMRVSDDNWELAGCPGSGIPFSFDRDGRIIASWMSRDRVYWARSDAAGTQFGPKITAPQPAGEENYPTVVTNTNGQVLLTWQEGSQVRWATYDRSGAFTGLQGVAGSTEEQDKPLALVGQDGRFRLVL